MLDPTVTGLWNYFIYNNLQKNIIRNILFPSISCDQSCEESTREKPLGGKGGVIQNCTITFLRPIYGLCNSAYEPVRDTSEHESRVHLNLCRIILSVGMFGLNANLLKCWRKSIYARKMPHKSQPSELFCPCMAFVRMEYLARLLHAKPLE